MKNSFEPQCRKKGGSGSTVRTAQKPDGTKDSTEQSYSWHEGTIEAIVESLGVSGILAILIIATMCTVCVIQVLRGNTPDLPKFLYEFSLLVLGYYFGQKTRPKAKPDNKARVKMGFETPKQLDQ